MKTVIVSGGFDPLHEGHIELLARAKMLGDRLVVLLNSDEWLIRKKGYCFMPWDSRAAVLRAMKPVDYVEAVDDSDGSVLPCLIMMDGRMSDIDKLIFANGGDRGQENTPELNFCFANDIGMEFGLGQKIRSSSGLMDPYLACIDELLNHGDPLNGDHSKAIKAAQHRSRQS